MYMSITSGKYFWQKIKIAVIGQNEDTKCHFVRQYIRDETVMIEFVRSRDKDSDIFTKYMISEIHHRHSKKLIWTKEEYELEA